MRGLIVLAALLVLPAVAEAQVELKNDGFQNGEQGAFQAGFVTGEAGASRFVAPEAGRVLQKVVFLFGGDTTSQNVTLRVWDDTAGTDVPGPQLYSGGFQVTGNDSAFQSGDMSAMNVVLPVQFRVGVQFQHSGLPSIARDGDGTIAADRNFLLADVGGGNFQWFRSMTLGVTGDWVIRAEISATRGSSSTDAGVTADASIEGGAPCNGNAQCETGLYCDLDLRTCTFDCRTPDDCGGNVCNSLGQCVGFDGDGGSCGCRGSDGRGGLGLVLGLGLFLVVRRR